MRLRHKTTGMLAVLDPGLVLNHPGKYEVAYDNGYIEFMRMEDICNTFTILYESAFDTIHQTIVADKPQLIGEYQRMLDDQARAIREASGYTDNNPKTAVGAAKVPLHLVPPSVKHFLAKAFADGAKKYGPYNWREKKVSSSVYYAALNRHMDAWWDGEEVADDSKIEHLAHAIACIGILIDAVTSGNLVDDRPVPGAASQLQKEYVSKKEESIERKGQADPVEQCGVSSCEANLRSPSRCC